MPISEELFEEIQDCLREAMELLNTLKQLARDAKPMVEEFQSPIAKEWLSKYKELFPNES
jgi:hypothetical protein